jgi:hypothetical protein
MQKGAAAPFLQVKQAVNPYRMGASSYQNRSE